MYRNNQTEQNLKLFSNSASKSALKDTVVADHIFNPYVDRGYILPQLMSLQKEADRLGIRLSSGIGTFYDSKVRRAIVKYLRDPQVYAKEYKEYKQINERLEREFGTVLNNPMIHPNDVDYICGVTVDKLNQRDIRHHWKEILSSDMGLAKFNKYTIKFMLDFLYDEAKILLRLRNNAPEIYNERSKCYSQKVYTDVLNIYNFDAGEDAYMTYLDRYYEIRSYVPRRGPGSIKNVWELPESVVIAFLKTGAYYGIQNAITFMGYNYGETLDHSRVSARMLLDLDDAYFLEHEIGLLCEWVEEHKSLYKEKYASFIPFEENYDNICLSNEHGYTPLSTTTTPITKTDTVTSNTWVASSHSNTSDNLNKEDELLNKITKIQDLLGSYNPADEMYGNLLKDLDVARKELIALKQKPASMDLF